MRSPEELTLAFRERGLKITPQRQAVFRVLHGSSEHPSAEAVHAAVTAEMPSVSLRTVYQVLNDLTSMGELAALDLGTGATRFDPTGGEHHHLVCTACGAVRDIFLDEIVVEVPAPQTAGYRLGRPEITFRGLCPDCDETTSSPPSTTSNRRESTHG